MVVIDSFQTGLSKKQLDLVVLPCSSDEDQQNYLKRIVARRIDDGTIIDFSLVDTAALLSNIRLVS